MKRIIALTVLFLVSAFVYAQHCPSGTVPIQGGGTCATTAAGAMQNLSGWTDARSFGVSPINTAAQNQTAFASLAAAVNAGTTPPLIWLVDGTYNVLSTGGTALGVYNIHKPVKFHCSSQGGTIINQTGTGALIEMGDPAFINAHDVIDWNPWTFEWCQVTGGASATGGIIMYNLPGAIVNDDYFYNYGNASMYAVYGWNSTEMRLDRNSYLRTDGVNGNFAKADNAGVAYYYTLLEAYENRVVCTTSLTDGASVACGIGIKVVGNLEAAHNVISGPTPAFNCGTGDGASEIATCAIKNNLLEGTGPYLIEFGTIGGTSPETAYNLAVTNNTVEEAVSTFGFVGPANPYVGLSNSNISQNSLRADAPTTQPIVVLNNVTGQILNQGTGNTQYSGWQTLHTIGSNINNWNNFGVRVYGNVFNSDDGTGIISIFPVPTSSDNFLGTALNSNWTTSLGAISVASQMYTGNDTGYSLSYWNALQYPANQFATAVITHMNNGGGVGNVGVAVRVQSGGMSGYVLSCSLVIDCGIYKVTAGVPTLLGSLFSYPLAVGNNIALTAVGNTLTMYINQGEAETVTDSTYASGQPGIWANTNSGYISAGYWVAGLITAPGQTELYGTGTPVISQLLTGPLYANGVVPPSVATASQLLAALSGGLGTVSFTAGAALGSGAAAPAIVTAHTCDSVSCQFTFTSGGSSPTSGTFFTVTFTGITTTKVRNCHVDIADDTAGIPLSNYAYSGTNGANPTLTVQYAGSAVSTSHAYRGTVFCFGN